MTDDIKLPPLPVSANFYGMYGEYTKSQVEALMREAVRLNAQAVPEISTEHGPWVESPIHEGETYCKRCLVRSVFAGHKKCEPHAIAAPAAPAAQGEPSDTERDAARYRWLRERVSVWRTNDGKGPVSWFPVTKVPASSSLQDATDAAIDWSIAAQQEGASNG